MEICNQAKYKKGRRRKKKKEEKRKEQESAEAFQRTKNLRNIIDLAKNNI